MNAATDSAPTPPPETTSPQAATSDAVARQLVGALLVGIALVLPLRVALGTTSDTSYHLTLVVAVVAVLGFGWVLLRAGVPSGVALAAATAGAYTVAVLAVLALVPQFGPPGDDTQVALLAGIVSAAFTAPVATMIVQWATDAVGARALAAVTCVLGFVIASGAGDTVHQNLLDARHDAELVAQFEESGLSPYLPSINGLVADYSSQTRSSLESGNRVVGYSLRYELEGSNDVLDSHVTVDVSFAEGLPCDPNNISITCRTTISYTVVERDGVVERVVADHGGTRLVASFREVIAELPDPDIVGAALASADEVEWTDVVSAGGS